MEGVLFIDKSSRMKRIGKHSREGAGDLNHNQGITVVHSYYIEN